MGENGRNVASNNGPIRGLFSLSFAVVLVFVAMSLLELFGFRSWLLSSLSLPLMECDTDGQLHPGGFASNKGWHMPTRLTNSSLAVMVLGRRDGFRIREAIRNTWANSHDNVYFVVGRGCDVPPVIRAMDDGGNPICEVVARPLPREYRAWTQEQHLKELNVSERLYEEQQKYGDLLIRDDFVDVYRTLPKKLKAAYRFVSKHLPSVDWVLKVDDDFYVRIDEFQRNVLEVQFPAANRTSVNSSSPSPRTVPAILGHIRWQNTAHLSGKWKEVPQYPGGAQYPPFPLGSRGHAVSRPIVDYVASNEHLLFDYQGEDVSIGIWLASAERDTFKSSAGGSIGNVFRDASQSMVNDGDCYNKGHFVIGHNIKMDKMRDCYNADHNLMERKMPMEEDSKRNHR